MHTLDISELYVQLVEQIGKCGLLNADGGPLDTDNIQRTRSENGLLPEPWSQTNMLFAYIEHGSGRYTGANKQIRGAELDMSSDPD